MTQDLGQRAGEDYVYFSAGLAFERARKGRYQAQLSCWATPASPLARLIEYMQQIVAGSGIGTDRAAGTTAAKNRPTTTTKQP